MVCASRLRGVERRRHRAIGPRYNSLGRLLRPFQLRFQRGRALGNRGIGSCDLKPISHGSCVEAEGREGRLKWSWATSPSRSDGACYCVEVTSFREKDSASPSDRRTLPPDFVLIGSTNECECELIFFSPLCIRFCFCTFSRRVRTVFAIDPPTHLIGVNENVPPNASMAEPVRELHSYLLHLPSYSA